MTMPLIIMGLLAVKSLLVAAVTLGLLRLTARRSAAERSTIAHLGLFALVALPLASLVLPSLAVVPVPEPMAQSLASTPPPATFAVVDHGSSRQSTDAPAESTTISVISGEMVAGYAYLLPAIALLMLTLVSLVRLFALRSGAQVLVDPIWLGALASAQRRMGFKSGTALLSSDELSSPISWGLMRPTILINKETLDAGEQAEAIIAHELAHVIHLDWAKLMLARVATAVFWFNPLSWVLAREAHQLREEAADDAVLAAQIAAPDYAELLVNVARHESRAILLGAHGVAPSRHSLRRRISRVLDANPARRASGASWITGFTAGMLVMSAPLAAVTFGSADKEVSSASLPQSPIAEPSPPPPVSRVAAAAKAPAPAIEQPVSPTEPSLPASPLDPAAVQSIASSAAMAAQESVKAATAGIVAMSQTQTQIALQELRARRNWPIDVDQLIQMRNLGITQEYRRAMEAAAGPGGLSFGQLNQARVHGVTPEYLRSMRACSSPRDSFGELVNAKILGLSPAYICEMRKLDIDTSVAGYQQMFVMGVTPDYVRRLKARGFEITSPTKIAQLRVVGFNPDDP